jgi:dihydropteroate synthase
MLITTKNKGYFQAKDTLRYNGKLIDLHTPLVMGILNITPDSFYDGGKFNSIENALKQAEKMVSEGASIIDIGACSTRPGAEEIPSDEELLRLLPVVREVRQCYPDIILSVDTYRSGVVQKVVDTVGDCIINDISGGEFDPAMFQTVASLNVPYVLMHSKGKPLSMQENPVYGNITKEVINTLSRKVFELHEAGVSDVIVDPGFGFGKTMEHNYELFNNLDMFRLFELPLMVGISRKSMIYKMLESSPDDSLNGTTVLNTLALISGASILRVHDVKEAVEAVKIVEQLKNISE